MRILRNSASWLSDDMAVALAAMCPPMQQADVRHAADQLEKSDVAPDCLTNGGAARSDADWINRRNLVETLRALRDSC
jgi:hypothetical protein